VAKENKAQLTTEVQKEPREKAHHKGQKNKINLTMEAWKKHPT